GGRGRGGGGGGGAGGGGGGGGGGGRGGGPLLRGGAPAPPAASRRDPLLGDELLARHRASELAAQGVGLVLLERGHGALQHQAELRRLRDELRPVDPELLGQLVRPDRHGPAAAVSPGCRPSPPHPQSRPPAPRRQRRPPPAPRARPRAA